MVNVNKEFLRPANMLLCLRNELNAVFPGRNTSIDGFVSGYGRLGISSHNANNLGHCMAFDITTLPGVDIDEPTGRALTDYLRTKKNEFFSYLIHDMSAGAPQPKIAGNQTKWNWVNYGGIDAHSNHIHISLTEDYAWGDPCGLAQSVYDRTVYWGIKEWYESYKNGGKKPQSIGKDDQLPSVNDVWSKTVSRGGKKIAAIQELANAVTNTNVILGLLGPVTRGGKEISLKQEIADAKTLGLENKEKLDKILALLNK